MSTDTISIIFQTIAIVLLYGILGFGPGFMIGIIFGNAFAARDKDTIMQNYEKKIQTAYEHNAQWHPSHERWKK